MELFYWLTIGIFVLAFAIAIRVAVLTIKFAVIVLAAVIGGLIALIAS